MDLTIPRLGLRLGNHPSRLSSALTAMGCINGPEAIQRATAGLLCYSAAQYGAGLKRSRAFGIDHGAWRFAATAWLVPPREAMRAQRYDA
jgi:hypothetical protein